MGRNAGMRGHRIVQAIKLMTRASRLALINASATRRAVRVGSIAVSTLNAAAAKTTIGTRLTSASRTRNGIFIHGDFDAARFNELLRPAQAPGHDPFRDPAHEQNGHDLGRDLQQPLARVGIAELRGEPAIELGRVGDEGRGRDNRVAEIGNLIGQRAEEARGDAIGDCRRFRRGAAGGVDQGAQLLDEFLARGVVLERGEQILDLRRGDGRGRGCLCLSQAREDAQGRECQQHGQSRDEEARCASCGAPIQ